VNAVIFDLDGTLVDSLDDIAASTNHVLRELGRPPRSTEEIARFVGDGARLLIRRAVGDAVDLEEEALRRFSARYLAHSLDRTRPYPGIEALLRELARREVPTAVLSNKPHAATLAVVEALFGEHRFVGVLGQRDGVAKKPDPAGALELCEELGREAADTFFVGDTSVDIETATRAGMIPIGVAWGYRSPAELGAAGARRVLRAPDDLLELLPG
jgi:phosphoglycolate phosphatase